MTNFRLDEEARRKGFYDYDEYNDALEEFDETRGFFVFDPYDEDNYPR